MSMFTAKYQDFKREDPTVLVKVTLYDDQKNVIKPAISKAKLVQGTKYAGDYEITQDGDQYCLSTKQIAKLPSGSYGMELWGDDGSIYPSAGFIPIRIHRNADDSLEKTKPTIDLDSIIEDLHKAGLNVVFDKIEMLDSNQPASITSSVRDGKNHITLKIPRGIKGDTGATGPQGPKGDKGDKGDTGTVDNAGLTTAPAFVSLQTQLDGITSNGGGRNLLTGTQGFQGKWENSLLWTVSEETYTGLTVRCRSRSWNGLGQDYGVKPNTTYTFSFYAKASESGNFMEIFKLPSEDWNSPVVSSPLSANQAITTEWKRYSVSFTTKSGGTIRPNVCSNKDHITMYVAGYMLEEGTVAHDWQPAPEDVPSNDSQLVHKTGNETIAGDKTLVGNTTLATTTILAGNYGLRVTTSGIQKTTDGKTWVPANI